MARKRSTKRRRASTTHTRRRRTTTRRRSVSLRTRAHNPARRVRRRRAVVHHRRAHHRRRNPAGGGGISHFAGNLAWAAGGAFLTDVISGFVPAGFKGGAMGAIVQGAIAYGIGQFGSKLPGVTQQRADMMAIGGGVRAAITLLAPVFNSITGFLRPASNGAAGIAAYYDGMQPFAATYGGLNGIGGYTSGMQPFASSYGSGMAITG